MMSTTVRPREPVHAALVSLLEGETWRSYFERCCFDSPEKLLAEVGRFRDAVVSNGEDYTEGMVREALLELAHELHPGSAAALPGGDGMGIEDGETGKSEATGSAGDAVEETEGEKKCKGLRLVEPIAGAGVELPAEPPRERRLSPEDYEAPEGFDGQEAEAPGLSDDGITTAEEIARARRALSDLVLADPSARVVYEKQCEQGLIGMFGRGKALRLALEARGEVHEQGAVEVAIPELAADTHPQSAAAAWERLLGRAMRGDVARLEADRRDRVVAAIVDLAAKEERYFVSITHLALDADGPKEEDLLGVSREVYAALRRRGRRVRPQGFSDYVWRALCEVLPDAPGVRWDGAWADGLQLRAFDHLGSRVPPGEYPGKSRRVRAAGDEIGVAYAAEDRRRYRQALRGWVVAARGSAVQC